MIELMTTQDFIIGIAVLIIFILVVFLFKLKHEYLITESRLESCARLANELIKENQIIEREKANLREENTNLKNIYQIDNFQTKIKNGEQN